MHDPLNLTSLLDGGDDDDTSEEVPIQEALYQSCFPDKDKDTEEEE